MHVLNADKSSAYFDSLDDAREDSAVRVIHWAWLEHSSTHGRLEHFEPIVPLDMLILYKAAAATFTDWKPGETEPETLDQGSRAINWQQAKERLQSIPDAELAALATRFANRVLELSDAATAEQDLNYCVELFLRGVRDKHVLNNIANGSISKDSKMLTDLDLW
jgi:hypothetical protein